MNNVHCPVNYETWEEDIESYMDAEDSAEWPVLDLENDIEGHPPEVSPEELKIIEEAAGQEKN